MYEPSEFAKTVARFSGAERKCGCGCGEIVGWGEYAYSDDCEARILDAIHADQRIDEED
jgi:hypothetical protein